MDEKTMTIVRKLTLYPQGDKKEVDRVYKYLRDGMEVQSQMMNMCISALYAAKLRGADKDEIREISHLYSHVPTSKKGSAYDFDMKKYPTGLPIAGSVPHVCKQKLGKAMKDGLMYGRVSLPTFKQNTPLMVHNSYIAPLGSTKLSNGGTKQSGLYHDYNSPMDLVEALEKEINPQIHIKFANNITFDIIFGLPHKSAEIRSVIRKVFEGEYRVCDSSIGIDSRTGKKIILNLSLEIPVQKRKLDENVCVGVDLRMALSAMCALNTDKYKRYAIGSYDDFISKRTQMQAERRRIQKALKMTKGGHGRAKKLAHLEKLSIHEAQWVKTYNHTISKRVVEFAESKNAKYINLEDLSGVAKDEKHGFVLRNWSYYELQQMIKAKAAMRGIEVRMVDPAYTTQVCSVCGEVGEIPSPGTYKCSNPECKSHKMYEKGFNAYFNAARNISMSEAFVKKAEKSKKDRKTA